MLCCNCAVEHDLYSYQTRLHPMYDGYRLLLEAFFLPSL